MLTVKDFAQRDRAVIQSTGNDNDLERGTGFNHIGDDAIAPHRGVALKVAGIKGVSPDDVRRVTTANAERLFRL